MQTDIHILAAFPPGLIFGSIVFMIWGLTLIFGKSKTPPLKKPTPTMAELAEIRRRVLQEQAKGKQAAQQQVVAIRERARAKPKRKGAPPPLPAPSVARTAAPSNAVTVFAPVVRATPQIVAPQVAHRVAKSEVAKNVRLMIQRNGIAEAFVLAEIFGKPKGLH